jgi:hypothetical protein
MPKQRDPSRSLVTLEQDATVIACSNAPGDCMGGWIESPSNLRSTRVTPDRPEAASVCPLFQQMETSTGASDTSRSCRFCSLMSQGATLILSGSALPLGACVLCVLDGT